MKRSISSQTGNNRTSFCSSSVSSPRSLHDRSTDATTAATTTDTSSLLNVVSSNESCSDSGGLRDQNKHRRSSSRSVSCSDSLSRSDSNFSSYSDSASSSSNYEDSASSSVNYEDSRSSSNCEDSRSSTNCEHSRSGWSTNYVDSNYSECSSSSSSNSYPDSSCQEPRKRQRQNAPFLPLPLEWWERAEDCRAAKNEHHSRVVQLCDSPERLILLTILQKEHTVMEPNMFPYMTPPGIEHYTLWSLFDLDHGAIVRFVNGFLREQLPSVRRWQYDDNCGERSIELFHVHVFVETAPFSFRPASPEAEYFPPHLFSAAR